MAQGMDVPKSRERAEVLWLCRVLRDEVIVCFPAARARGPAYVRLLSDWHSQYLQTKSSIALTTLISCWNLP